jgi:uracil-DNA glycosylase family 4
MRRVDPSRYEVWGNRSPSCTSCILHNGATTVCVPTVRLKESSPCPPSKQSVAPSSASECSSSSVGTSGSSTKQTASKPPAVVCIGQNPGSEEDRAGVPFVGPSGHLLVDGYLLPARIHEIATIYITNSTRCLTAMNAIPPFAKCRRPCFLQYTQVDLIRVAELHAPNPLYLLCVGAPAATDVFRILLGHKKAPSQDEAIAMNGRTWKPALLPVPVVIFSTFHPAYILRVPNNIEEVHHHMGQLQRHLLGDLPTVTAPTLIAPTPP